MACCFWLCVWNSAYHSQMEVSKPIYISLFDIHGALMLLLIIDVCIFTISMAVTILSTFNRTHHSFFNGMFGCKKKKEGEQSRRKESNSITLFGSFLRKEEEGIGGNWRAFNYLQPLIFNSLKLERFGGRVKHINY